MTHWRRTSLALPLRDKHLCRASFRGACHAPLASSGDSALAVHQPTTRIICEHAEATCARSLGKSAHKQLTLCSPCATCSKEFPLPYPPGTPLDPSCLAPRANSNNSETCTEPWSFAHSKNGQSLHLGHRRLHFHVHSSSHPCKTQCRPHGTRQATITEGAPGRPYIE